MSYREITYHEDPSLDIYLREISRVPLLSPEQELELAQRAQAGDRSAMDRLAESNLRFVVSTAREFQGRGLSMADLINEGNVGLMKAVQRFDVSRNCRFNTYAIWWIRQAMLKAIAEQTRTIRLPMNRIEKLTRINRAVEQLKSRPDFSGAPPTIRQISRQTGMPVEEIRDLLGNSINQISLDAPYSEDGETRLSEIVVNPRFRSPEEALKRKTLEGDLRAALAVLSPREIRVLKLYFGLDDHDQGTLDSIGRKLNISRERVRQLRDRALKKIKLAAEGGRLRAYLS
jgi:RNA polymerase primary sigma factor